MDMWRRACFRLGGIVAIFLVLTWIVPAGAESLDPNRFKDQDQITLGNITIDKKKKEIRVGVRLALTKGILEYLLVGDMGKAYESVFKVDGATASELNFGLLLLGLEPLDYQIYSQALEKSTPLPDLLQAHPNSFVSITIVQRGRQVPYGLLMVDREKGGGEFTWVYTGGFMTKTNRFSGDLSMSWIGIWGDRNAMLNLYSTRRNPYRGPFGLEMNEKNKNLAKDQPFELVLRPLRPR